MIHFILIRQQRWRKLFRAEITGIMTYTLLEQPTFTYRMVVSSTENHALAGILTKAMYAMPQNLVEDLAAQYTTYKAAELTFVDWIRLHPVVTVLVLLIFGWPLTTMAVIAMRLSARKKAQKAAREKAEELAELAEHVQAANKAKTAFLSHMSHDMRTPLNAIMGFTGIAMKNNPSDEVKNCLEKIDESSEHLLSLINDVLDLARVESGKVKYNPVPADLKSITDSALDITKGFLTNRDISFKIQREEAKILNVLVDPVRLRDVLVNILSNAVKFTPDGGTITFEARCQEKGGDGYINMHYRILDTGIGMSEEFTKQAIQMIGENIGIDLMLLDINMPQMNGFEVLKIMKRSQCIAETPVIMISSEDAVDTMRKAYELGITDYITRPFDSVIVKKRVQNTLGLYMNQKHLINVVYDQVYEKEENNNIMIRIMSNILGSRNSESREHILHIKTATEMMLRQLVKVTDAYPLTEADIALITTASSLHDIGKIRIPEEILNKPGRLTDEEFQIMKTHSELGAAIIKDMDFPQDHPLVHTAWEICRWHHERWDGKGYPDGLKGEEIPISAQVVSIVDVYDALTSERCYKKAFDHDTAIQMILDGQCGQFNPLLLKCLKELSFQLSKMSGKEMDDNKYSHEIQRLSNEILRDKSLPNQIYSQSLVKVMQEKIDFFKSNSGMNSIDYNAVSGQLTILNGNQQILCQRNNPKIDLFKEFGVNEEDAQYIRVLLHQTSVQNKEISVQIKATVENNSQMYKMKLHTLWSPMKKDVCIGIIGYFDTVK